MSLKNTPDFVYRLASPQEWAAAQASGVVPSRDIDARDGYMHLSTRAQALETARIHFADAGDLLALEIPFAVIADAVKFELAPKRGEHFPHLYAPLKVELVSRVLRLTRKDDDYVFGGPL